MQLASLPPSFSWRRWRGTDRSRRGSRHGPGWVKSDWRESPIAAVKTEGQTVRKDLHGLTDNVATASHRSSVLQWRIHAQLAAPKAAEKLDSFQS